MILCDTCSTLYDLALLFSWPAQYFRQMEWRNRKMHWYEAVSSVTHLSIFEGSLAELFRF